MAALVPYRGRWITASELRSTYEWKQLRAKVCPPGSICYLCGGNILFGLRRGHRWGPSVDHIVPLELGGAPLDPANCLPCHVGCNAAKGDRLTMQHPERVESWIE